MHYMHQPVLMPRLFEHQLLLHCSSFGREKYQKTPAWRCFFMSTGARTFLSQEQSQLSQSCSGIKQNKLQSPRYLLGKQSRELEERQA